MSANIGVQNSPGNTETAVSTGTASNKSTPAHPKNDEKKSRVILNILPKLPSTDSLSNSPGPGSPGMSSTKILPILSYEFNIC